MRNIPLSVLLSFPSPNYKSAVTRGPAAVITVLILSCFVVIAVSLRVYTRVRVQSWSGMDDLFIVLAVLSTIGLNVSIVLAMDQYGWNHHVYDIPPSLFAASGLIIFIAKLLFFGATSFLRLSLLSFYYRLVHEAGKNRFRCALHASVVLVITLLICSVFLSVFVCIPVSDYWRYPPKSDKKCYDEGRAGFVIAIINCITDAIITCLPIPLVVPLNMPLRDRVVVLASLCLGFIVLIASALRTYYYYLSTSMSYDITWTAYPLWITSAVEVNVALICACAPALRIFIKRKSITSLKSFSQSMNNQEKGSGTEYSNPPNSPVSFSFQRDAENRAFKLWMTSLAPTSPNSPTSSTSTSSLYPIDKAEECDSSINNGLACGLSYSRLASIKCLHSEELIVGNHQIGTQLARHDGGIP